MGLLVLGFAASTGFEAEGVGLSMLSFLCFVRNLAQALRLVPYVCLQR